MGGFARRPRPRSGVLDGLLERIEQFFIELADIDGVAVLPDRLEPASHYDIDRFERTFQISVPADVKLLWRRGFVHASASMWLGDRYPTSGDHFCSIGHDFLALSYVERDLPGLRSLATLTEGEENRLVSEGIPITFTQPQLIVDAGAGPTRGAVFHYSTRTGMTPPIASSLTEFLDHWFAVGCFGSHNFAIYYPLVKHLLPMDIPLHENLWLRYYDAQFRTSFATQVKAG